MTASSSFDRNRERSFGVIGRRPAGDGPALPQLVQQVAQGQRRADVVLGERVALGVEDAGLLRQAAGGQRDVGRDDDVARPGLLGDPVVGRAEARAHDQLDQRVGRHPQRGVGHDRDAHRVAAGDAVDLVLDRAGVGVDVDGQHGSQLRPFSPFSVYSVRREERGGKDCWGLQWRPFQPAAQGDRTVSSLAFLLLAVGAPEQPRPLEKSWYSPHELLPLLAQRDGIRWAMPEMLAGRAWVGGDVSCKAALDDACKGWGLAWTEANGVVVVHRADDKALRAGRRP